MIVNNDDIIVVTQDDGTEGEYVILFTYHSDDTDKDYCLLYPASVAREIGSLTELRDAEIEYVCFEYKDTDETTGEFFPIETEEEYELLEDALNDFFDQIDQQNA